MEFLKSLFTKPLSYDEFVAAVTGAGIKLADLSGGEYVAKGKLTEMTDKNKALAEKVASYEKTIGDLKASAGNTDALQSKIAELEKNFAFEAFGHVDDDHEAMRFVCSWATKPEAVDALIESL